MTKVIILNSGTGSRMRALTETRPKCLVDIGGGETILGRQLKILESFALKDILITTGPFEEKIEEYLKSRPEGRSVSLVNNPAYERTNYIYSLILAGEFLKSEAPGEVILLHGDLVFDRSVLGKLLAAGHPDAVLTNPGMELPEKDFKAVIDEGRVKKIGVELFGKSCVFLIPFYKMAGPTFTAWLKEMERFRARGELQVYAENALNNLLPELGLKPVELEHEFCMEIDDPEDLDRARNYFAGGGEE